MAAARARGSPRALRDFEQVDAELRLHRALEDADVAFEACGIQSFTLWPRPNVPMSPSGWPEGDCCQSSGRCRPPRCLRRKLSAESTDPAAKSLLASALLAQPRSPSVANAPPRAPARHRLSPERYPEIFSQSSASGCAASCLSGWSGLAPDLHA